MIKEVHVFPLGDEELRVAPAMAGGDSPESNGRYRAILRTPDLLLLRNLDGPAESSARERVLMAGEIVGSTTVLEVISMISSSRWVGTLHVYGEGTHRLLGFYKGVLRHAHSDHPEDRLDKVLVRVGVLKPTQVEEVMQGQRTEQRFRELLVEQGLVERQQLFGWLREQMGQILLSAVLEEEGSYVFCVPRDDEAPPPATAHIPLQQLLLDAAERVDRLALFRRLVASLEMRPEVSPGVEVAELDSRSRLLLGYSDGERSLREIAGETWLGRFETVATVYDLVRSGRLRLRPPRLTPVDVARQMVEPCNATLRDLYAALERHGDPHRLRRELARWVAKNPEGELLTGGLDDDGLCRSEALAAHLTGAGTYHQREALLHALHELASFALFTASLSLPRDTERELSRRLQRRLEKLGP